MALKKRSLQLQIHWKYQIIFTSLIFEIRFDFHSSDPRVFFHSLHITYVCDSENEICSDTTKILA